MARGRKAKGPPTIVRPEAKPAPQVFVPMADRARIECTHCHSTRVRRNGGSPSQTGMAHFVCFNCTDGNGDQRTFKLRVARPSDGVGEKDQK